MTTKKTVEPEPRRIKKKIIRIRKLKDGKPIDQAPIDGSFGGAVSTNTIAANAITASKIASGSILTGTLSSGVLSGNRVTINPAGLTFQTHPTWGGDIVPAKKKEVLDFKQEDLDKKDLWSTGESAWFCGMSRTSWHVYMTKNNHPIAPVQIGKGRGKQNLYAASDIRALKAKLDS